MGSFPVLHSVDVWLPLTQTWLHNQVRHLPAPVRSTVACRSLDGPERWPGVHVRPLPRRSLVRPWASGKDHVRAVQAAALARRARWTRARIVHSHFGHTAWRDLAAVRHTRAAHVLSFYGHDLTSFPAKSTAWGDRYRELLGSGAHALCEGPHMAAVARTFGGSAATVHVHHLGVDLSALPFRPRAWRRGEPLRVLMAASFREKKGLPDAIRALGEVAGEFPVEATLVGDAEPTPNGEREKANILEALRETGLDHRVRRLGYVDAARLRQEAYAHHLFLSPSRTAADGDTEGGVPVGLLEMAASGMPVVTTRHCDIPYALGDAYGPYLSPEGDVDALVTALRRLASDPSAWQGLAETTRQRMESHYDCDRQGQRLAALYAAVAEAA